MAVIPGAAAPDQAPLYQQRSRRMDKKKRKTQATTTCEFLRGGDQTVGSGMSKLFVLLSHFLRGTYVVGSFFCHVLFQIYPVSPAVMMPLRALPSQTSSTGGLREWEGPERQ